MLEIAVLLLLVQGLILFPQQAGEWLDEAVLEHVQQRAEYLNQQTTRLIQELEQMNQEQSGGTWGDVLGWQFWALAGIVVLHLALRFALVKWGRNPDNGGRKERSSSNLVEEEEAGGNVGAKKETESSVAANVEDDEKGSNEEGSYSDAKAESSAGNEAKEGYNTAKEEVKQDGKAAEANVSGNAEDSQEKAKGKDDDHNAKRKLGSRLEERMQLPVPDLDKGCQLIMDLMDKLTHIFGRGLSNSFYPVPQQAVGVGSAFEGWSAHAQEAVYRVLVPLSPPPGHAFRLELDTAGMLQRNFCVRVELLCTCTRERRGEDMLCFLHHPEEELRRRQDPSLLHTLCTGSYLDVEKTVHWFCGFVRVAWLLLPQSRHWRLTLQPCSRSCKFQLSKDKESFTAEMIFAVRQGDSDIFVCSQPAGAGIPSTAWPETYAVAEANFFRHISRQAPQDSCHCKCLQLLTGFLMGVGFSSYALKTVVMHLLNTIPLTRWRRRDFGQRLMDILKYLRCSLDTKRLHHFVVGNASFPMEIRLPSGFRVAEAPNLFEHLASSADAHRKAVQEYNCLLDGLKQLTIHGH
ncbi:hypothetical protein DV515_00000870 [Chloebia gouldiae]|uniref:Mab-21-like HhH/H2TH-like domain-containing protein n=1 Tax=Chloebia gouldiae TaxID=44316 RepID=A0A3L8SZ66_CHLGU|nr:hypothetical protein DV515_00000870 [Chloebia gouldiae]